MDPTSFSNIGLALGAGLGYSALLLCLLFLWYLRQKKGAGVSEETQNGCCETKCRENFGGREEMGKQGLGMCDVSPLQCRNVAVMSIAVSHMIVLRHLKVPMLDLSAEVEREVLWH